MHSESLETFNYIAQWIDSKFFFSIMDKWDRFGMLGVLGDFVLSANKGNILEIGTGESSIYLTALAKKHNRKIYHCDIAPGKILNPLTVPGYFSEENEVIESNRHFKNYVPKRCLLYIGPSDDFFKDVKFEQISLAFIDGDHLYEQVKKDFYNTVALMSENGYIFLHDTYPPSEEYVNEYRCGTVYQLRQELEKDKRFDVFTFNQHCAMKVGLTMVRIKPVERKPYNE